MVRVMDGTSNATFAGPVCHGKTGTQFTDSFLSTGQSSPLGSALVKI